MARITLEDLARKLSEKEVVKNIPEGKTLIKGLTEVIKDSLIDGDEVVLTGIGTFSVAEVAERKGRNPKTGEELVIPKHKAPKFKFTPTLKDCVK